MKKLFTLLVVVSIASLFLANPVFASPGDPAGSCPSGFTLEEFMDHDGEHMHRHIGITQDINGDGYICMQPIVKDLHLHVDNTLPLP